MKTFVRMVTFSVGLDKITVETESRKRKPACKATEDKKKLKDEDEDYQPKLTPGYHPAKRVGR